MRIVVTNCHTRMGYAVANSLTRDGHQVVAAARRMPSMAAKLPGVVGQVSYPDPYIDTPGFLAAIRNAIVSFEADLVFPVHEETFVLSKYRDTLPVDIVAPPLKALMEVHDKLGSYRLAIQAGVDAPLTICAATKAEIAYAAKQIGWPKVIKPRFGSGANEVKVFDDAKLFDTWLAAQPDSLPWSLLVQQYCAGRGVGFGCFVWDGQVRATAGHVRLREVPAKGGTSTARRTFFHDGMEKAAQAILERSAINGVGMVEFRFDDKTGRFAFLEINPRYWGGVATAIASGVDFPVLHLQQAIGVAKSHQEMIVPRELVESRWVMGEIRAAAELASRAKIREIAQIFQCHQDYKLHLDDFDFTNPGMFFHQFAAYMSGLAKQKSLGGHSDQKNQFFVQENREFGI